MGVFDKLSKENLENVKIKDPRDMFKAVLQSASGADYTRQIRYSIFYRIIGFKGIAPGVGCSTIVANTAVALADLGLTVCVIDTSILHPTQFKLLNAKSAVEGTKDWFDMPFTETSVLRVSGRNKHISVLGFERSVRNVLDLFSALDSPELIDTAVEKLSDKFDVILIDLCEELTRVNVYSMQKAQHVIQVWDDSIASMENLDGVITDSVILSCPLDKMRYVVENKMHDDVMGNLESVFKQYRFRHLGHCCNSVAISRLLSMGTLLWQYPTKNADIIQFTEMIIEVVKHICNIDTAEVVDIEEKETNAHNKKAKPKKKKRVTAAAVSSGEVEGTYHHKLRKQMEENPGPKIVTPDLTRNETGASARFRNTPTTFTPQQNKSTFKVKRSTALSDKANKSE